MPEGAIRVDASDPWFALLVTFTTIRDELAKELETETGLPMDRYEILLMLAKAENGELQPSELADRRRLSRSGATRLIDRLAADGLVERRQCDADRRVSYVRLTDIGRDRFAAAARVHGRGIDQHVTSRLSPEDAAELGRILGLLVDPRAGTPAASAPG